MKTVVIGIGNPILTDDSVGVKVAGILRDKLDGARDVDVIELYAGGIRLMDAMAGYERAVIIDAIVTDGAAPGRIFCLSPSDLLSTRNTVSTHDMNLPIALEMGRMLGIPLPSEIRIWGIEARDVENFSEDLTEDVAKAVPEAVEKIIQYLGYG
jgi:hydrogenase maturation protease